MIEVLVTLVASRQRLGLFQSDKGEALHRAVSNCLTAAWVKKHMVRVSFQPEIPGINAYEVTLYVKIRWSENVQSTGLFLEDNLLIWLRSTIWAGVREAEIKDLLKNPADVGILVSYYGANMQT